MYTIFFFVGSSVLYLTTLFPARAWTQEESVFIVQTTYRFYDTSYRTWVFSSEQITFNMSTFLMFYDCLNSRQTCTVYYNKTEINNALITEPEPSSGNVQPNEDVAYNCSVVQSGKMMCKGIYRNNLEGMPRLRQRCEKIPCQFSCVNILPSVVVYYDEDRIEDCCSCMRKITKENEPSTEEPLISLSQTPSTEDVTEGWKSVSSLASGSSLTSESTDSFTTSKPTEATSVLISNVTDLQERNVSFSLTTSQETTKTKETGPPSLSNSLATPGDKEITALKLPSSKTTLRPGITTDNHMRLEDGYQGTIDRTGLIIGVVVGVSVAAVVVVGLVALWCLRRR